MSTTYPPIKSGTRVKVTVRRTGKGDYSDGAIVVRTLYAGSTGIARYGVTFEDGGVAFFDPEELEVQ